MSESACQEALDTFYMSHGPCCAGCDWWRSLSPLDGECHAAPPVPSEDRWSMLGVSRCTLRPGAGQPMTKRDHFCGAFRDEFDWSSLPLAYRKRIGDKSLAPLR